jgi:hypothetical protein
MGVSIAVDRLCRGWRTWTSSCASPRRVVTSGRLAFRCSRGLIGFSGGHFVESFNIGGSHFYQYCSVKRICFANETEM